MILKRRPARLERISVSMTELGVTATLNINDLPFTADRTRAWRELREAGEAVSSGEEVVLTSAEAVEFAAKRPEIFSSARAFDRLGSPVPLVPIAIDPPDHTRFRRMLDPFFSPKKMAEREPELRRQAGELIDAIVASGECDVVADLATPFPSQVFLTLFGLPMADRDRLVQWKDAILQFTDPSSAEATPEVMAHALELFTYLTEHIAERRANSTGSDMLTQLIQDTDEGGMSDNEILGLCFMFVLAGLDTVTSAVGFSLARLAGNAEMRHRVANDFALIRHSSKKFCESTDLSRLRHVSPRKRSKWREESCPRTPRSCSVMAAPTVIRGDTRTPTRFISTARSCTSHSGVDRTGVWGRTWRGSNSDSSS